jgi:hypothetical protein
MAKDFIFRMIPYFVGVGACRGENFLTQVVRLLRGPDGSKMPEAADPILSALPKKLKDQWKDREPGKLVSVGVPGGHLEVTLNPDRSLRVTYPDETGAPHEATLRDVDDLENFLDQAIIGHTEIRNLGFANAEFIGSAQMAGGSILLTTLLRHELGLGAVASSLIGSAAAGFGAGAFVYWMAALLNPLSNNSHWFWGAVRATFNVTLRMGMGPLLRDPSVEEYHHQHLVPQPE